MHGTQPTQVIEEAAREPLEPTHENDMEVPSALMSQEQVIIDNIYAWGEGDGFGACLPVVRLFPSHIIPKTDHPTN